MGNGQKFTQFKENRTNNRNMNAIRTTFDFFGTDWIMGRSGGHYYFWYGVNELTANSPDKLWAKISKVIQSYSLPKEFRKENKMKAKKPAKKAKKVIKKKKK
jgi:hypothetical protein